MPEDSGYDLYVEHGFHVVAHDRRMADDPKRSFSLFSYNREIFGDSFSDRLIYHRLRPDLETFIVMEYMLSQ